MPKYSKLTFLRWRLEMCKFVPECESINIRVLQKTVPVLFTANMMFSRCFVCYWQGRFYIGTGGNYPQTSALHPKCDIKLQVPQTYWHIGAKRSVLWPSDYAKIHFWPGSTSDPAGGHPAFGARRTDLMGALYRTAPGYWCEF